MVQVGSEVRRPLQVTVRRIHLIQSRFVRSSTSLRMGPGGVAPRQRDHRTAVKETSPSTVAMAHCQVRNLQMWQLQTVADNKWAVMASLRRVLLSSSAVRLIGLVCHWLYVKQGCIHGRKKNAALSPSRLVTSSRLMMTRTHHD